MFQNLVSGYLRERKMLNNYNADTTFDTANIINKNETLPPSNLLETKVEPHHPNSLTQESCPFEKVHDEHNYTLSLSEARQKLENELSRKEMTIKDLRREFAVHKKRCSRQESSIRKLKLAVSNAKQKMLISKHLLQTLNNNLSAIMLEIFSRASGDQNAEYSEALRRFALNVYLYSPAAYRHIRESFNNCLPHANMIRRWHAAAHVRFAPNTKHELSATAKNQAPDTEDQTSLSQDVGNQRVMSPDLENQANLSPGSENQLIWSHNTMDHDTAVLSSDTEDQAVLSQDKEDKAISLLDIQDHAIQSYDRDQVILSPDIEGQPVSSHDIEDKVTLSPPYTGSSSCIS